MKQTWALPVVLEGRAVRLEPLSGLHREAYLDAALADPSIFKWVPQSRVSREDNLKIFDEHLAMMARGDAIVFATVDRASGRLVGSTLLYSIAPQHKSLEIGYTWIIPEFQRTAINTEAKYLQLRHCFETLGCNRVALKTDALNERSRNAMLRIGCKEEGTLRNHMVCADGRIRNTVFFSILPAEWPQVKASLEERMARGN